MSYVDRIGNTMIYEWWRGNRKSYPRLLKLWQMAQTGSKQKSKWVWGRGPYPTTKTKENSNE